MMLTWRYCFPTRLGSLRIWRRKDSEGSEWIINVVDKEDTRPVWIAAWSGMNTLAQALWKVSHTRTPKDVEKFVSKLRMYG